MCNIRHFACNASALADWNGIYNLFKIHLQYAYKSSNCNLTYFEYFLWIKNSVQAHRNLTKWIAIKNQCDWHLNLIDRDISSSIFCVNKSFLSWTQVNFSKMYSIKSHIYICQSCNNFPLEQDFDSLFDKWNHFLLDIFGHASTLS